MKKCPHCGKGISEFVAVCPNCHNDVNAIPEVQEREKKTKGINKLGKSKYILLILACLCFCVNFIIHLEFLGNNFEMRYIILILLSSAIFGLPVCLLLIAQKKEFHLSRSFVTVALVISIVNIILPMLELWYPNLALLFPQNSTAFYIAININNAFYDSISRCYWLFRLRIFRDFINYPWYMWSRILELDGGEFFGEVMYIITNISMIVLSVKCLRLKEEKKSAK